MPETTIHRADEITVSASCRVPYTSRALRCVGFAATEGSEITRTLTRLLPSNQLIEKYCPNSAGGPGLKGREYNAGRGPTSLKSGAGLWDTPAVTGHQQNASIVNTNQACLAVLVYTPCFEGVCKCNHSGHI